MIIERELLVLVVFSIVFKVDEFLNGFSTLTFVFIVSSPHLNSEILLICKALINDSYTHYLIWMGESMSNEILNKTLPYLIQKFECGFLNIIQK